MKNLEKSLELLNKFLSNESEKFINEIYSEISALQTENVTVAEYFDMLTNEYILAFDFIENDLTDIEMKEVRVWQDDFLFDIKNFKDANNSILYEKIAPASSCFNNDVDRYSRPSSDYCPQGSFQLAA